MQYIAVKMDHNKRSLMRIGIYLIMILLIQALIQGYIFTELKSNIPSKTVFTIDNSADNLQNLEFDFIEDCGKVTNYKVYILKNISKTIYEPKITEECQAFKGNKSEDITSCFNTTFYYPKQSTSEEWVANDPRLIIPGIIDYRIEPEISFAKCKGGKFGYQIDWIPSIDNTETGLTIFKPDWAWWNVSYTYRRKLNCSLMTINNSFMINGSNGINLASGKADVLIWTQCQAGNFYLYYNNDTSFAIANETSIMPYDVESNPSLSYKPKDVWNNVSGLISGFTWGAAYNDSTGLNHGTSSGDFNKLNGSTYCKGLGSCLNLTKDDIGYVTHGVTSLPIGNSNRTYFCWIYETAVEGGAYIDVIAQYGQAVSLKNFYWANNGGNFYFNSAGDDWSSGFALPLNKWMLTGIVTNSTSKMLYLNTTLAAQQNVMSLNTNNSGASIGGLNYAMDNDFNGYMDECRIYNRTLKAPDFLEVFNTYNGIEQYGSVGTEETNDIITGDLIFTNSTIANQKTLFMENEIFIVYFNYTVNSIAQNNSNCTMNNTGNSPALMVYNTTLQMYQKGNISYLVHGNKTFSVGCVNPNPIYNIATTEYIWITNIPPVVNHPYFIVDGIISDFINNSILNFSNSSTLIFFTNVSDDDLSEVNNSLQNGTLVYSELTALYYSNITVSGDIFKDGTYSYRSDALDSFGDTIRFETFFNVTKISEIPIMTSISLSPANPFRGDVINCTAIGTDDTIVLVMFFEWYDDSVLVQSTTKPTSNNTAETDSYDTISSGGGSNITCKAWLFDTERSSIPLEDSKILRTPTGSGIGIFLNLATIQGGIIFFILVFFWISCLIIALIFKNLGVAMMGFFTGVLIGFILTQLGFMFGVGFLLIDIVIFMGMGRLK